MASGCHPARTTYRGKGTGIARRWRWLVMWGALLGNDARAADPPPETDAADAARASLPAAPADGDEVSKVECVSQHEHAQMVRRQRQLLDARTALRRCSRASCPWAIRADCVDWLDQVARSLPSVVVTARARGADVADVRVLIDGKLATDRLSGGALDVDPGQHRLRFESPQWPAVERTILVSEGVQNRAIDVEFAPPAPVPMSMSTSTSMSTTAEGSAPAASSPRELPRELPPPRHARQTWTYLLGGVAVAGLGTFVIAGSVALHDRGQLEQSCAPFCNDAQIGPIRTKLAIADVGFGVALASLAAAAFLHFTNPDPTRSVTTSMSTSSTSTSTSTATSASAPGSAGGVSLLVDANRDGAGLGLGGVF